MSAGAGLGVTWGDGVLEYRGEKYPFTVRGFDIGDVGVAKVIANGMVFNLRNVEDFSGAMYNNVQLTQEAKLQAAKVRTAAPRER